MVHLNELIGDFGAYQLALCVVTFVRYVHLSSLVSVAPLIAPDVDFYCELPGDKLAQYLAAQRRINESTLLASVQLTSSSSSLSSSITNVTLPSNITVSKLQQLVQDQRQLQKHLFARTCQVELWPVPHTYQPKFEPQPQSNPHNGQARIHQTAGAATHSSNSNKTTHSKIISSKNKNDENEATSSANAAMASPVHGSTREKLEPELYVCHEWKFDDETSENNRSLTSEFELVCDREMLRSIYLSVLAFSVAVAHVVWGAASDKYGRARAVRASACIALLGQLGAAMAPTFALYTVCRCSATFAQLGVVVSLSTLCVETLDASRVARAAIIVVNAGYALGVAAAPYLAHTTHNFRHLMLWGVASDCVTLLPLVGGVHESVRWLMGVGRSDEARRTLASIERINGLVNWSRLIGSLVALFGWLCNQLQSTCCHRSTTNRKHDNNEHSARHTKQRTNEQRFELKQQFFAQYESSQSLMSASMPTTTADVYDANRRPSDTNRAAINHSSSSSSSSSNNNNNNNNNNKRPVSAGQARQCLATPQLTCLEKFAHLFASKQRTVSTASLVWTNFNSELLYMSFIIINLDVGEDVFLNYVLGGLMEVLGAGLAIVILARATCRHALSALWLGVAGACVCLAAAHVDSTWAVTLLCAAKLAQSALSAVACVAAFEVYPTYVRQTGSGTCSTLGMLGAVVAPFVWEMFDDSQSSMDTVLVIFGASALSAGLVTHYYLADSIDTSTTHIDGIAAPSSSSSSLQSLTKCAAIVVATPTPTTTHTIHTFIDNMKTDHNNNINNS